MQVRARNSPGSADSADDLADGYSLTFFDLYVAEVAIHRYKTLTMIDDYGIAVEKIIACR